MWRRLHERIRGWRTLMFHGILTSLGAAMLSVDELRHVDWSQLVSVRTALLIGIGLNIAAIWLRFATKGPVGCSEPEVH